jgi:predicted TIM-barrel fold metal-dependent hydrolase
MFGWYDLSRAERTHKRSFRPPWWAATQNTLDRATATLPSLLYERMDEIGLDFAVLYPSVTLLAPDYPDEELRRAACRAANLYHAEYYGEYSDRMAPVAVIPMHTPEEAIAELDFAIGELGLKAVMMAGSIRRPVPAAAQISAEAGHYGYWIDTLGIDSAHDYDPVWQRCVELGVSPTFHSSAMTWGSRGSVSNYVYNHIGAFGAANEGTCRSLFLGGVPRRFPTLRFGFLEGGVGWACSLYSDLVSHWEKRGHPNIRQYDPETIDESLLRELFMSHGGKLFSDGRDRLIGEIGLHSTPEDRDHLDEFEACEINDASDIKELFCNRFYFGCEADDPINAWAFNDRLNPMGARLRAMFSSDIGHWDVPDMSLVTDEAYELVERGHLDEEAFRDFVFGYPAEFWTAANPAFFEGTAVEGEVAKLLASRA